MGAPINRTTGRQAARLDGERSRTRILDAAERLLADKGFSGTGIAAISRESGLPPSSIYWFFASKRELMMAVVERAAGRFLSQFEKPDPAGARLDLRSLFERAFVQFGSRLPDFLRLRILLALERGDSDPDLRERLGGVSDRINQLAARAIEASLGAAACGDARRTALGLAPLAIALANGALISLQTEPDTIDIEGLPEDLEVAILAIAEHRLCKEKR